MLTGLCQEENPVLQKESHHIDNLGHRLPFRQLGGPSAAQSSNSHSISFIDKTEKLSGLQSSSHSAAIPIGGGRHGSGSLQNNNNVMHTGGPKHVEEPELLTSSQDIEVVLGDTTVLPCKVAQLGTHLLFVLCCILVRYNGPQNVIPK